MSSVRNEKRAVIEVVPRHALGKVRDEESQSVLDFLEALRDDMQRNMLAGDPSQRKGSVADYLKLVAAIEERQRAEASAEKEITVRWEEAEPEDEMLM
jgi:hypothetical protein